MKYMLLMYQNESNMPSTPEELEALRPEWQQLVREANAAKVLVSNSGVAPGSSATSVRIRDGKTLITDGPFAETHEQLGGYFVFDLPNLDEALKWAAKIPTAKYGTIEVRPLWSPG